MLLFSVRGYLHTLQEDSQPKNVPEMSVNTINEDNICIIVEPIYHSYARGGNNMGEEEKISV